MQIFFSVGEPSGDQHAAHLIHELRKQRPDVDVRGFGGPHMEEAGCRIDFMLTTMAVMGFFKVLPMIWKFYKQVKHAEEIFKSERPDAVVLVDFPGFNWWIARKAKKQGIPVYYYLPPQLWAWAAYRIRRVRKYVDHVLCALPFEYDWYRERGVKATYVGHPFFDEVEETQLDPETMEKWGNHEGPLVAVLPGSRGAEIQNNWPIMLDVMQQLKGTIPKVHFLIGAYKKKQQERCEAMLAESGYDLPLTFLQGKAPEVIELGDCCLMVSGSISLEVMARRTPAVVVYYVNRLTYKLGEILIRCNYICLPNIMADKEIMSEFPCTGRREPTVKKIYDLLHGYLNDPEELKAKAAELDALRETVFSTGASKRVASFLVEEIDHKKKATAQAA
ncbi:Glycosyl transferase [Polystyrenella longa]|uniref:Lipid-A-disaccharide synthase n=1 Tax=Polystyrenella longa TaxID=2528007 RepID=A0A518CS72_9PLAN|nr:lipid-A-disaccharide synthase [Polystyrenella longa]QDU82091.1 Glycosyl transferase [Polystyrenella longa]